MIDRKYLAWAILALAVIVGFLGLESCLANAEARDAHAAADGWRGQFTAEKKHSTEVDTQLALKSAENQALTQRVTELLAKRKPVPPAPPVPETDEELRQVLTVLGASPDLKVLAVGPSAIHQPDAKLFVAWGNNSARIPAFEERVGADTAIIAAQKDLEVGLRTENRLCMEKGKSLSAQVGMLNQESLVLRKENEALVRVQVAQKYKTRIILGGSILGAAYLGYKVGRK